MSKKSKQNQWSSMGAEEIKKNKEKQAAFKVKHDESLRRLKGGQTYLLKAKLKSQDMFKLVLVFLPIPRCEFHTVLLYLKLYGDEFYKENVKECQTFKSHDLLDSRLKIQHDLVFMIEENLLPPTIQMFKQTYFQGDMNKQNQQKLMLMDFGFDYLKPPPRKVKPWHRYSYGNYYQGEYDLEERRDGRVIWLKVGEHIAVCRYKRGKWHGQLVIIKNDGKKIIRQYCDGQKVGEGKQLKLDDPENKDKDGKQIKEVETVEVFEF